MYLTVIKSYTAVYFVVTVYVFKTKPNARKEVTGNVSLELTFIRISR